MGKIVKLSLQLANGLKIYDSENNWTPGGGVTPPRGNMHVYHHNIQRSFSETAWPIKTKFDMKHL